MGMAWRRTLTTKIEVRVNNAFISNAMSVIEHRCPSVVGEKRYHHNIF